MRFGNTLEIFADFACPWCYFMMPTIERLKKEHSIEVKWRAHLLNPMIPEPGEKIGRIDSYEELEIIYERIAGKQNLPWVNNRMSEFQTQPAHIISKWADESDLGDEYRRIVYYYYFVLQKNIALPEVLKEIIIRLGMYEVKPHYILEDEKYIKLVEDDLKLGNQLGIEEAPTILYNGERITGFVKYEELVSIFNRKGHKEGTKFAKS